jgi:hypothetical protein
MRTGIEGQKLEARFDESRFSDDSFNGKYSLKGVHWSQDIKLGDGTRTVHGS